MMWIALLLSRLQFAFTVSFHVMPLTLIYTAVVYRLFRGKVTDAQTY